MRSGSGVARAVVVLGVVGVVVAGCTSDPSPSDPHTSDVPAGSAAPGTAGGSRDSAPIGTPTPSLSTRVDREMPWAVYGDAVNTLWNSGAPPEGKGTFDAREALIAECMKSQGFDYWPREYVPPDSEEARYDLPGTTSVIRLPALADDRETVAAYGYGVDDIEAQEALRNPTPTPDANADYQASLAPEAQSEYFYALSGEHGYQDPNPDPSGGCSGPAYAQYPQEFGSAYDPYRDLAFSMSELIWRGVYDDPRLVALNAEWSECMLNAGVDMAPPEEYGPVQEPGPYDAYDLALMTPADGSAVQWPAPGAPAKDIPLDRQYLVGSAAERQIALADYDCRKSTDYVDRFVDILVAVESEFVAQHKDELDAMVAAASGVG